MIFKNIISFNLFVLLGITVSLRFWMCGRNFPQMLVFKPVIFSGTWVNQQKLHKSCAFKFSLFYSTLIDRLCTLSFLVAIYL